MGLELNQKITRPLHCDTLLQRSVNSQMLQMLKRLVSVVRHSVPFVRYGMCNVGVVNNNDIVILLL